MTTASREIREKIKQFEGLCLRAMQCPAGIWTIGYGHTGKEVVRGKVVNVAEAEALFDADIALVERQLAALLKGAPPLTQRQFDALISFVFNLGIGTLSKSTLWRKVKANPADPTIPAEFRRWVNAAGKKLNGLVKRRETEARWYQGL